MKSKTRWVFFALSFAAMLVSGCGSIPLLKSTWLDHDLALGPDTKDWPGGLSAVGDMVSVGTSNNRDWLFLALVVQDFKNTDDNPPYAHSLAANGLTVWVDPQGGDHKTFNLSFRGMEGTRSGSANQGKTGGSDDRPDQALSSDLASNGLTLTDEKGKSLKTTAQALQAYGFEIRTSYSGGRFIYVMKLPLHPVENSPFPSGLAKSQAVGFGFEGNDFNVHRSGGGSGGGSGNVTEKFNLWLSVNLASK